jgi:hypothetical protein
MPHSGWRWLLPLPSRLSGSQPRQKARLRWRKWICSVAFGSRTTRSVSPTVAAAVATRTTTPTAIDGRPQRGRRLPGGFGALPGALPRGGRPSGRWPPCRSGAGRSGRSGPSGRCGRSGARRARTWPVVRCAVRRSPDPLPGWPLRPARPRSSDQKSLKSVRVPTMPPLIRRRAQARRAEARWSHSEVRIAREYQWRAGNHTWPRTPAVRAHMVPWRARWRWLLPDSCLLSTDRKDRRQVLRR